MLLSSLLMVKWLFRLGCRQCRAEHANLNLAGLTTSTTPRDITIAISERLNPYPADCYGSTRADHDQKELSFDFA